MKFRGGYSVLLAGRPAADILDIPAAGELCLPLRSARLSFSHVCVSEGDVVAEGQVLAMDPANYGVPLLAPRAGTVSLETAARHVVLREPGQSAGSEPAAATEIPAEHQGPGPDGEARYNLLRMGVWPFLFDAKTGNLPDPATAPQAVIVSLLHLEPFVARGDAIVRDSLDTFVKGLDAVRLASGDAPLYLVLPDIKAELADRVRDAMRGKAGTHVITVPLRYPLDDFRLLPGQLRLGGAGNGNVWGLRAEGVMAANRALADRRPCTARVVAVGGPGAVGPKHVRVSTGQPLAGLLKPFLADPDGTRVIAGGVLTGADADDSLLGVDVECTGLTLLPQPEQRRFFEFARMGFSEHSFARCFLSVLRPKFMERFTSDMKGEHRPCIACNFCDDLCPAGLLPFQLYRYLRHDALEEAEATGLDACIGCGLCSYVCPSKIEISKMLIEGQGRVERELRAHRDGQGDA